MIELSIIIINYNTFQLTCNCIKSIYEKCIGLNYEIILVDNASNERDANEFLNLFPNIKLIISDVNIGFAKGNNLGISTAIGKNILLLNSDTELVNDALTPCVKFINTHEKVGVVTTKLIFPDGRIQSTCQRFPNVFYNLLEFLRFQKFFPQLGGKLLLGSFFDYRSRVNIDWTWGAFFMFRKELLIKLPQKHLYDGFFMYCEDIKWCLDIKRLGYKISYIPNGDVIHYMGASAGAKKPMMIKNHEILMQENFSVIHRKLIAFCENLLK